MKKLTIMGLVLFAFAFVGCGDSKKETDEEKCNKQTNKEWKDGKCVDKVADPADPADPDPTVADYTIKNTLAAADDNSNDLTVSAEGYDDATVAPAACLNVKGDAANLKVAVGAEVLCDSSDDDTANDCAAKNGEVKAATSPATGNVLDNADTITKAENCADMTATATE